MHLKHVESTYKYDETFFSIFIMDKNSSSYLYVFQTCFKHTTSMCKNYEYMKKNSHDSIIKLLDAKFVITYQKEFVFISSNDV
jgi:hypothetical protein